MGLSRLGVFITLLALIIGCGVLSYNRRYNVPSYQEQGGKMYLKSGQAVTLDASGNSYSLINQGEKLVLSDQTKQSSGFPVTLGQKTMIPVSVYTLEAELSDSGVIIKWPAGITVR